MIGILIISHGPLAEGILESSRFFYDDRCCIRTQVLAKEDDPSAFFQTLKHACEAFEDVEDILILTDIPGGTPANTAQMLMQDNPHIHLLSGVNLMMALDAVLSREMYDLDALAQHCRQSAIDSIQLIGGQEYAETDDVNAEF